MAYESDFGIRAIADRLFDKISLSLTGEEIYLLNDERSLLITDRTEERGEIVFSLALQCSEEEWDSKNSVYRTVNHSPIICEIEFGLHDDMIQIIKELLRIGYEKYSPIHVNTEISRHQIVDAEQFLIDRGVYPDEACTVLQAIGYALLGVELYPEKI